MARDTTLLLEETKICVGRRKTERVTDRERGGERQNKSLNKREGEAQRGKESG